MRADFVRAAAIDSIIAGGLRTRQRATRTFDKFKEYR
jgi:hypothetical protein